MLFLKVLNTKTYCDWPDYYQLGMQDPATPMMEGMIYFHNFLMYFIIFIGIFVIYLLGAVIYFFNSEKNKIAYSFAHSGTLEIAWTVIPAILLLFIAVPSFTLLYSLDELIDPQITLKIIGHQWYWSYESSDYATNSKIGDIKFDAYLVPYESLKQIYGSDDFRLLSVDQAVILPNFTHIRLLVSSADVLHSWTIPSFGIKVDACPGRLSQASLFITRYATTKGWHVFFGQCSEICGVNHGFMPIIVKVVPIKEYIQIISNSNK